MSTNSNEVERINLPSKYDLMEQYAKAKVYLLQKANPKLSVQVAKEQASASYNKEIDIELERTRPELAHIIVINRVRAEKSDSLLKLLNEKAPEAVITKKLVSHNIQNDDEFKAKFNSKVTDARKELDGLSAYSKLPEARLMMTNQQLNDMNSEEKAAAREKLKQAENRYWDFSSQNPNPHVKEYHKQVDFEETYHAQVTDLVNQCKNDIDAMNMLTVKGPDREYMQDVLWNKLPKYKDPSSISEAQLEELITMKQQLSKKLIEVQDYNASLNNELNEGIQKLKANPKDKVMHKYVEKSLKNLENDNERKNNYPGKTVLEAKVLFIKKFEAHCKLLENGNSFSKGENKLVQDMASRTRNQKSIFTTQASRETNAKALEDAYLAIPPNLRRGVLQTDLEKCGNEAVKAFRQLYDKAAQKHSASMKSEMKEVRQSKSNSHDSELSKAPTDDEHNTNIL